MVALEENPKMMIIMRIRL